jgi:hypothetical protein
LEIWGPYANYDDIAKLEYGRLLWKSARGRRLLLSNWTHPGHPHKNRFLRNRRLIKELLDSTLPDSDLDASLRRRSSSIRVATREIPGVFGSLSKKIG